MKLVHGGCSLGLEFRENEAQVLTVEHPAVFAGMVRELYRQCDGGIGDWFLSDAGKELSIAKKTELVLNPVMLDINNRKILGKLHQEMKAISQEEFYVQAQQINGEVVRYLDQLSLKLPYPIVFNTEMDVSALYKMYDLKLEDDSDELLQKIIHYIGVLGSLCGISLVIFVNLKAYLQDFELLELYKTAFYGKMNLLLLEPVQRNALEGEHNVVIDQQKCVIEF